MQITYKFNKTIRLLKIKMHHISDLSFYLSFSYYCDKFARFFGFSLRANVMSRKSRRKFIN